MEQRTDRLYPSAPIENDHLEQRLEKRVTDVNSFKDSINNNKEMITDFRDKIEISRNKNKKYKTLSTILKSIDENNVNATTSNSFT